MIRRALILTIVALLAVATAACDHGPRVFCFGEGGHVDECVSTASRGSLR